MGEAVKKGEAIPLSLQLSDEITDAFVEADVVDADKTPLAGSPVELAHTTDGHYLNETLLFPETDRVFAFLRVWTDNTKTKRHPLHCDTFEDIFPRNVAEEKLQNLNIDDFNKLLAGVSGELTASTEETALQASLDADTILTASVDPEELTASEGDESELVAEIETKESTATTD